MPDSTDNTPQQLAPSKWVETQYSWRKDIGIFTLCVSYDAKSPRGQGGFTFSYNGFHSKNAYPSAEEAMAACENAVKRKLKEALTKLG